MQALARRLLRDVHQAEDAAQDTWLAALSHGGGPGLFEGLARGWLGTVVRNFALQTMRGSERRRRREHAVARGLAVDPDTAHYEPELLVRVQAAVHALPDEYRVVVHERFFADRMPMEIADALGLPVETVRTRLKRALVRLRGALAAPR